MSILVFDIETIPDTQAGRKLYNLQDLTDKEVAQAMYTLQRAKSGHEFLPHYLHCVIAISVLLVDPQHKITLWTLGEERSAEADIIQRFFKGIEKNQPTLVSWNGSGFDLPVLHYRSLLHGVSAPLYWEHGDNNSHFRWNNYLSRYHYRHTDLMDILAAYQNKAFAPLDDIAVLLGFPGKMGMHGSKVFDSYLAGDIQAIRNYCETDVLNTYGVYLRFELMRGNLSVNDHVQALDTLKTYLANETTRPHLQEFLNSME